MLWNVSVSKAGVGAKPKPSEALLKKKNLNYSIFGYHITIISCPSNALFTWLSYGRVDWGEVGHYLGVNFENS